MANYYEDLGLTPSATHEEVKAAFYRLAKQHHPDKQGPEGGSDASEFRKVREAYEKLCERAAKTSSELPKSKNEAGPKKYNTCYHSRPKPPRPKRKAHWVDVGVSEHPATSTSCPYKSELWNKESGTGYCIFCVESSKDIVKCSVCEAMACPKCFALIVKRGTPLPATPFIWISGG